MQPSPQNSAFASPTQITALKARLWNLNMASFALAVPGIAIQVAGRSVVGMTGLVLTLVGTILVVAGLSFYARMRGYHPAYGLLGLLSCLGLIVLYFLPKKCLHCAVSHSYSAKTCTACAAPLGS